MPREDLVLKASHYLTHNKIAFTSHNDGKHFRIGRVDYYPTKDHWKDDDVGVKGEGLEELIKYIKQTQKKEAPAKVMNGKCCPHCKKPITVKIQATVTLTE